MGRKPGRSALRPLRTGIAAASWLAGVCATQAAFGPELGRAVRQLEDRIELRLRGAPSPEPQQPARTHEESIEPWELVSV